MNLTTEHAIYTQRQIKKNVRNRMNEIRVSYKQLSKQTGINLFKLILILYTPVINIKLTQGLAISKALKLDIRN